MKKIILMLMATFCWNELNASVVNIDMTPFKTNGSKTDGGKSKVWFSTLYYWRPIYSTKRGIKTQIMNRIARTTINQIHQLFPKLTLDTDLDFTIHNAIVDRLKSANRKVIYIHAPINNQFTESVECPDRTKRTRHYTIIPVKMKDGTPAYLEIKAFKKGLTKILSRTKYDDSNITIKVTKPSGADSSTDGAEEDEGNEEDEA